MAFPGTLGCQQAALTQLADTAGASLHSRLSPYISSVHSAQAVVNTLLSEPQTGTDRRIPPPRFPTGGTYLPLLGGWTSRTGHKHGAAGESRLALALALARRSPQLTQRAPRPRLLPASLPPPPGSQKGPPREIGATQRAAASSRLGRQSHTPASRVTESRHGYWLVPIVASLEPGPAGVSQATDIHREPRGGKAREFGVGGAGTEVDWNVTRRGSWKAKFPPGGKHCAGSWGCSPAQPRLDSFPMGLTTHGRGREIQAHRKTHEDSALSSCAK
ncbi:uncharacterized protein isoform X3 [Macaca fascicularis]